MPRGDKHIPLPDPVPGYPAHGVPCAICGLPGLYTRTDRGPGSAGWAVGCPRCLNGVQQLTPDKILR